MNHITILKISYVTLCMIIRRRGGYQKTETGFQCSECKNMMDTNDGNSNHKLSCVIGNAEEKAIAIGVLIKEYENG